MMIPQCVHDAAKINRYIPHIQPAHLGMGAVVDGDGDYVGVTVYE